MHGPQTRRTSTAPSGDYSASAAIAHTPTTPVYPPPIKYSLVVQEEPEVKHLETVVPLVFPVVEAVVAPPAYDSVVVALAIVAVQLVVVQNHHAASFALELDSGQLCCCPTSDHY